MQRLFVRTPVLPALLGLVLVLLTGSAMAQYQATLLVSDLSGKTMHTDPLLKNPWGLAYAPGGAFWVSDEASGWSTLYNGKGDPQSLQVVVPPASGGWQGSPTGIVYNGSTEFQIDSWTSVFLFATLDGTISGWSGFNPSAALIAVTNPGASYTGLAITSKSSGNSIFAADFANDKVDIYDGTFTWTGSFTDPTIPPGFAPFGIQDLAGRVYVAFAATSGGPGGYIDVFEEDGTFVKRLSQGKPLNQPWGLAKAPDNFGPLSNTLLVSNNVGAGTVNGFNPTSGKFVGTVRDTAGDPIIINGIWGIEFGGGTAANGLRNQLFFTAGPQDTDGFFGVIVLK
jgi:uncharacterized protein (TIGR03118 family)